MGLSKFLQHGAVALATATVILAASLSSASADETGMASIHEWRVERGKVCMSDHFHTGNGSGRTKKLARVAAIKAWQEFTAWEYGTTWASFRRAGSKSISYSRSMDGWDATVEARACKRRTKRRGRRRN